MSKKLTIIKKCIALVFIITLSFSFYGCIEEKHAFIKSYSLIVEVSPVDTNGKDYDKMPASIELDFKSDLFISFDFKRPVDIDSIQVFAYDYEKKKILPREDWAYARCKNELPSHFIDKTFPEKFPIIHYSIKPGDKYSTFHEGALLHNVRGTGQKGRLV